MMQTKHKIGTLMLNYSHYAEQRSGSEFSERIRKITLPVNCGRLTIEEGQYAAEYFHVGLVPGEMAFELAGGSTTGLTETTSWQSGTVAKVAKIIYETRLALPVCYGTLYIRPLSAEGHAELIIMSNTDYTLSEREGYRQSPYR